MRALVPFKLISSLPPPVRSLSFVCYYTDQLSPGKDGKRVTISKSFTVEVPRVEFADPRMNRSLLVDLAERTKGRYFDVDEAGEIAAALPDRRETLVVRGKPVELWDTSRLLLLLALLLTVEWALRKRFKLL